MYNKYVKAQINHLEQVYNLAAGIKEITEEEKQEILDDKIRDESKEQ